MKRPEQLFHLTVAQYLRAVLEPCVFWSTFPAGGGGRIRGALLKAMGLKAGVPDICLIHDGRSYWIELKAPKRGLSPGQIDTHFRILKAGGHVATCKTIDEVQSWLSKWKVPTRVKVAA